MKPECSPALGSGFHPEHWMDDVIITRDQAERQKTVLNLSQWKFKCALKEFRFD